MNAILKISAVALTASLVGFSAQAQNLDNASKEVFGGVELPVVTLKAKAATPVAGTSRSDVQAELARARAAGELDFAYAEVNGSLPQRGSVTASDLRVAARTAQ